MSELINREDAINAVEMFFKDAFIEDADVHCADLEWEINRIPAASPWHRVEDELPKFGEYVLAWEIQGFAVVDKYVGIGDGRWDLENDGAIYTHWMPLPEPPKEVQL